MTISCLLCGLVIDDALVSSKGIPIVGDPQRTAYEYQAVMVRFHQHVANDHNEYFKTLALTANTYHIHLVAKLASSTDEDFTETREHNRRLCYWTLKGDFAIQSKTPPAPPTTNLTTAPENGPDRIPPSA